MKYAMLFVGGWLAAAFLNVGFMLAVILAVAGGGVYAVAAGKIPQALGMGERPRGELGRGGY